MRNQQSKNIIITGTSRGIGFELVHLFANAGYNVLALSRNAKPVKNLHFDNITSLSFDLTNEDDYKKVEDFIKDEMIIIDKRCLKLKDIIKSEELVNLFSFDSILFVNKDGSYYSGENPNESEINKGMYEDDWIYTNVKFKNKKFKIDLMED